MLTDWNSLNREKRHSRAGDPLNEEMLLFLTLIPLMTTSARDCRQSIIRCHLEKLNSISWKIQPRDRQYEFTETKEDLTMRKMVSIVWFWRRNNFTLFFFQNIICRLGSKYIGLDSSRWHFVAFAWRSKDGNYVFVVNSFSVLGLGKFEGKTIESGNILIGQQSENVNLENPFSGRITCLQMWKTFLSKEQIEEIYKGNGAKDGKCQTNDDSYRFLTWAQVKTANTKGEVTFHWPSELIWSPSTAVSYS